VNELSNKNLGKYVCIGIAFLCSISVLSIIVSAAFPWLMVWTVKEYDNNLDWRQSYIYPFRGGGKAWFNWIATPPDGDLESLKIPPTPPPLVSEIWSEISENQLQPAHFLHLLPMMALLTIPFTIVIFIFMAKKKTPALIMRSIALFTLLYGILSILPLTQVKSFGDRWIAFAVDSANFYAFFTTLLGFYLCLFGSISAIIIGSVGIWLSIKLK